MTTISANGATEAIYLRMNGSAIERSVGTLTTPSTWSAISSWPATITNTNPIATAILNVVVTQNLTISSSTGGVSGFFIAGSLYITFNGAGFDVTISGITSYPGLIRNGTSAASGRANVAVKNFTMKQLGGGSISDKGGVVCQSYFGRGVSGNSIENCTNQVSISSTNGGGGVAGAFAGYSGGSVTFTGCTNSGPSGQYTGGIAGQYAGYSGGSVTFTGCTNSGVLNSNYSAGIAGYGAGSAINAGITLSGHGSATFINCTNTSSIIGVEGGGIAGGQAGSSTSGLYNGSATFINCRHTGNLQNAYVGGITGRYAGNGIRGSATFTGCTNSGEFVSGSNNSGGIAGSEAGASSGSVTFTECTNNGPISNTGAQYSGGIAGSNAGSNLGSATFTNCTNSGVVTASNAGGIVGHQAGNNGSLNITGCTNNGTINGSQASGIASTEMCRSNGNATITDCTNNGAVSGSEATAVIGNFAGRNRATITITNCRNNGNLANGTNGGIIGANVGFNDGSSVQTIVNIINCTNTGVIATSRGGIVGGGVSANMTITNCTNSGAITASNTGGIVGEGATTNTGISIGSITITDCTNNGDITGNRAGGIVGASATNASGSVVTLTNCINNGKIGTDTSGASTSNADQAGGMSGFGAGSGGKIYFINCTNTGEVNARVGGGFAGNNIGFNGEAYFRSCLNTGIIRGISGGGIVSGGAGQGANGYVEVTNCANTGDIHTTAITGGGLVGSAGANVSVSNSYNTGAVNGLGCGGIVGDQFAGSATRNGAQITNCYSTGVINATYAGGIFGSNASGSAFGGIGSSVYTTSVSNCYSLGNMIANSCGIGYTCVSSNKVTLTNCYSYGTLVTAGSGIILNIQPLSISNVYVANGTWTDASANANLTSTPTGTGIAIGQATTWTSLSANVPYLRSNFFSLTGSEIFPQIYTPNSISTADNGSSVPGLYQPGVYSFANTSQVDKTFTAKVYAIGGTTPKYYGYGYTTYSINNTNGGTGRPITATINGTTGVISFILPYPCFLEGTKILCFENNQEVYRPVESLRKGDLVKTIYNGYLPIHMIGTSPMYNPNNDDRIASRLYKCSKENYPTLIEDLYITGCHSILVPWLTYVQGQMTIATLGKLFVTDKHCRLMAWVDEKAEPYTKGGMYNIYHIALENDDYYMNYGIYANGLLVESCSKRYLTEMSNMRVVGEEDSRVKESETQTETLFPKMTNLIESC